MHPDANRYIQSAPADQRPILSELRGMIVRAMPDAQECVKSGFPVYKVGGAWAAGFASRKKSPMLYIMAPGVLDRHAGVLGKLRGGRSCVEFRETGAMSLDRLRAIAAQMLNEAAGAAGSPAESGSGG